MGGGGEKRERCVRREERGSLYVCHATPHRSAFVFLPFHKWNCGLGSANGNEPGERRKEETGLFQQWFRFLLLCKHMYYTSMCLFFSCQKFGTDRQMQPVSGFHDAILRVSSGPLPPSLPLFEVLDGVWQSICNARPYSRMECQPLFLHLWPIRQMSVIGASLGREEENGERLFGWTCVANPSSSIYVCLNVQRMMLMCCLAALNSLSTTLCASDTNLLLLRQTDQTTGDEKKNVV